MALHVPLEEDTQEVQEKDGKYNFVGTEFLPNRCHRRRALRKEYALRLLSLDNFL